jgi:hypothetical protein
MINLTAKVILKMGKIAFSRGKIIPNTKIAIAILDHINDPSQNEVDLLNFIEKTIKESSIKDKKLYAMDIMDFLISDDFIKITKFNKKNVQNIIKKSTLYKKYGK